MAQSADDSIAPTEPHSVSLLVTFVVITGAGVASWAVVLTALYFAWKSIRSLLT
jgi:hypothetical protein